MSCPQWNSHLRTFPYRHKTPTMNAYWMEWMEWKINKVNISWPHNCWRSWIKTLILRNWFIHENNILNIWLVDVLYINLTEKVRLRTKIVLWESVLTEIWDRTRKRTLQDECSMTWNGTWMQLKEHTWRRLNNWLDYFFYCLRFGGYGDCSRM